MNVSATFPVTFEAALDKFIEAVKVIQFDYANKHGFPVKDIGTTEGGRYIKVFKHDTVILLGVPTPHSASVYCFVDKTNGDILKGSWKAPVKNGVRGNIFSADVLDKVDQHGPKYLR